MVAAHHSQPDQTCTQIRHLATRLGKRVDGRHDPIQVVLAQRRMDRKGQDRLSLLPR